MCDVLVLKGETIDEIDGKVVVKFDFHEKTGGNEARCIKFKTACDSNTI